MKAVVALLVALPPLLCAHGSRADECRPPAPGSWSSSRVVALHDSGTEHLARARSLEGDEQRAAAARAEVMFREIEKQVGCLPTTAVSLARALELQGKLLQAAEQYRRVLDATPRYPFYAASLREAEQSLPIVLGRTARVALHLRGRDCAVGTPRAFLDAEATSFDVTVRLNPGEHRARVEALGCSAFSRDFTAASSTETSLIVDLLPLPTAESAVDSPKATWLGLPPWAIISAGAVLAIGAGVGGYVLFSSSNEAPPNKCNPAAALGCIAL
jgi:hypothetical protein